MPLEMFKSLWGFTYVAFTILLSCLTLFLDWDLR